MLHLLDFPFIQSVETEAETREVDISLIKSFVE
jgi:hypothetical protein